MSELFKTKVFIWIPAVFTIVILGDYFLSISGLTFAADLLRKFAIIISSIALGLGVANLAIHHSRNVQKRKVGIWPLSIITLVVFTITFVLGTINERDVIYKWIFDNVYNQLQQTFYATTGFYIVSSAYRAFRARNIDATLLLLSGCILMLTNAPVGELLHPSVPAFGRWLLDIGQLPAQRIFMMIAAFGLMAYGLRVLLGKERGFYGAGGR